MLFYSDDVLDLPSCHSVHHIDRRGIWYSVGLLQCEPPTDRRTDRQTAMLCPGADAAAADDDVDNDEEDEDGDCKAG